MHASGRDLLHLINDILDLSKIESGSASLEIGDFSLAGLASELDKTFRYLAEAKGLHFVIELDPNLPTVLRTDAQRLKQVLTNLLSNAVKFTAKGTVSLAVRVARTGWSSDKPLLAHAAQVIAFSVSDSGIGIAPEKRKVIFEAFQQADASTARRYGGTGLGLAISREIALLLGGELDVMSEEDIGSTFTFFLPQQWRPSETSAMSDSGSPARSAIAAAPAMPTASGATPLVLIIEDDPVFGRMLQGLARDRGFESLIARSAEEGIKLAQLNRPDAITLDLELPDLDGWQVAERLQADPQTCDIPVHIISVRDRPPLLAQHPVASFSTKPADMETLERMFAEVTAHLAPPIRTLLLIENDPEKQAAIIAALASPDRVLDTVVSAAEALAALHQRTYQGMIIEVDLPGEDGLNLLRQIRGDTVIAPIPAVLYAQRKLDSDAIERIRQLDAEVGDGHGALDMVSAEVEKFLQGVQKSLPHEAEMPGQPALGNVTVDLTGKSVLIVDDDARNLFALTGLLESYGMTVLAVDNGDDALRKLADGAGIDIVLMDIMMPDLDGYEVIRRIRADSRFARLPIIALTAKAMLEDRSKCIEAGASDYASKPVDTEQLLGQLSNWLS